MLHLKNYVIVKLVNLMTTRLNTGLIQCDTDWPGVFIRGDDALYIATMINSIESLFDDLDVEFGFNEEVAITTLQNLKSLLLSSDIRRKSLVNVQKVTLI